MKTNETKNSALRYEAPQAETIKIGLSKIILTSGDEGGGTQTPVEGNED